LRRLRSPAAQDAQSSVTPGGRGMRNATRLLGPRARNVPASAYGHPPRDGDGGPHFKRRATLPVIGGRGAAAPSSRCQTPRRGFSRGRRLALVTGQRSVPNDLAKLAGGPSQVPLRTCETLPWARAARRSREGEAPDACPDKGVVAPLPTASHRPRLV